MKLTTDKYNFICDKCYILPEESKTGKFDLVREVTGGFLHETMLYQ